MPDFSTITWMPLVSGLTLLGLIGSWVAWRRRGAAAGLRGVAWSLLPVSLYLTGLLKLLWEFVASISDWVVHLVFSPKVWVGLILVGVSAVLYVLSGTMRTRGIGSKKKSGPKKDAAAVTASGPKPAADVVKAPKKKADDSSDFDEIEDILKRHGIN